MDVDLVVLMEREAPASSGLFSTTPSPTLTMESGIEAPLHSSPTAKSNNGSDLVVDSLSLHPSPTMSSPALLTASSSTLAETVNGGSLSLPSSTVSLSTPDPVSQVQATDSPLGSDNTLAQATDSFFLSTENVNASVSNGLSISLNVPPPSQQQVAMTQDVNKSQAHPSETAQDTTKFVPTLGAWAKPLFFKPPATPPEPSTPRDYDPALVGTQLATLWPSLNDEILNKKPKSKHPTRTLQPPIEKLPPPELKADGSLRFPWAARLSPQSRNLYRAATPTYRLDGTPEDCSTSTPEVFESTTSKLDGQGVTVPVPALPSVEDVHDLPSGTSVILDGTGNQILGTSFTSSHFQQEKPADLSNSVPTLPRLVDSSSTPIVTQIMESFPSSNINTEI
ncbi:hypothetical protein HID58_056113 [Brassica napus]|uniref:Uncharacterized protein n=1 Tax=Brassica napus TaxID=3708 RepID=A0ABQ8AM99_BRANA|nr:hypothetical protein HID58_056113 [Brassica napus]